MLFQTLFFFSPFFVYCAQKIAFVLLSSFLIFVYISIGCAIFTVHAVKIEKKKKTVLTKNGPLSGGYFAAVLSNPRNVVKIC
jgi:predicted membrane protein